MLPRPARELHSSIIKLAVAQDHLHGSHVTYILTSEALIEYNVHSPSLNFLFQVFKFFLCIRILVSALIKGSAYPNTLAGFFVISAQCFRSLGSGSTHKTTN